MKKILTCLFAALGLTTACGQQHPAKNFENRDYKSFELEQLGNALNSLDERSKYIIKRRWLDEQKATLQELSNELKVSVERVRQIETSSLKKIKEMILHGNAQRLLGL